MDSKSFRKSETLVRLAQRLLLLNPNAQDSNTQNSASELVPQQVNPNTAAVLICLFEGEKGDLRVILTRRSSTMSSHSGEVALPGGKRDACDLNNSDTALREAKEEIGLDPSIVEVVTILEPFHTKKEITVFPVVGILWDKNAFKPAPNADEVESIFDAPLEMFLKDENRREEEREWMGYKYLLHFFNHPWEKESYVIWALTAGILIKAASIVYQKPPAFEERRPTFWKGGRTNEDDVLA
ncbi:nudix hydrolase 15, mitochondrial-like [Primulina huaijiensis]|uniref:nudix hydrolase 15, mitochondrial-like n=1 Tax=Primulina huaijiensis TaxID=1492673 RepID=UPI003CC781DB